MKNQTSNFFVAFLIMGIILMFNGCPANPTQNNQIDSNQNNINRNASDEIKSTDKITGKECQSVDNDEINEVIRLLPQKIRRQFGRNITSNYIPAEKRLILKGYIEGKGSLGKLLNGLKDYQGTNCIAIISLIGDSENIENFEWRIAGDELDTQLCTKGDVDNDVRKGKIREQIDEGTLKYNYSFNNKTVEFGDYIHSKNEFGNLMDALEKYQRKACITKIVFKKETRSKDSTLLRSGFEWQICEGNQCEYNGECINPPCRRLAGNTNTNTSGNMNNSNVP